MLPSKPVADLLLAPFEGFFALMHAGGIWVLWIFFTSVLMWGLIFERFWYFRVVLPHEARHALSVWEARDDHHSWAAHQIRRAMISRLNAGMVANMPTLKVMVPLSPLLGLVGTVSGMLAVFDSMAALGSADARTMSSGVSEAMNCTLAGLVVSISGMYPAYYFQARARRLTEWLGDQFTY